MRAPLTIATRKSPLALWQANAVKHLLEQHHPALSVELLPLSTQGDQWLQSPLARMGGKGLFVKELEQALLQGDADLAVHSMKDVPIVLPQGLVIQTILPRANPQDVLISNTLNTLEQLKPGLRIGTSSLRRQVQLKRICPDLDLQALRGNINTRLTKLEQGHFDAIVLAAAGLERLEINIDSGLLLPLERMLPACGQGVIGIECRDDDGRVHDYLAQLHHAPTACVLSGERAVNQALNAGCQSPVGVYGVLAGESIWLRAFVSTVDAQEIIQDEIKGPCTQASDLGAQLAQRLFNQGAENILKAMGLS